MATEIRLTAGWLKEDLARATERLEQLKRAESSVTQPANVCKEGRALTDSYAPTDNKKKR